MEDNVCLGVVVKETSEYKILCVYAGQKPKVYSSPFYYFKTLIDNFYGAKVLTEGEEFHVFYKLERHGGE